MKKYLFLSAISIFFAIASYINFGARSQYFRISLVVIVVVAILGLIYFRNNISKELKRGRASKARLILFVDNPNITLHPG